MKPVAYEGTEPYIFVSYAHRDAERVFEVLDELQNRGYRFWYDDGIAPGSEWPEDIAQHLDASAMVMAFVTPNSMKSQNCRREINFSLSREKPFLSVLLEETDMPLGMQMQLSAQQSILRYNYDSWQAFVNKILACPGIEPCRKEPEPKLEPAPAAEPVREEPMQEPSEPEPAVEDVAPMTPAVAPAKKVSEAKPTPQPTRVAEDEKPAPKVEKRLKAGKAAAASQPSTPKTAGKKINPIVIVAAALAIAAIALVFFITGRFKTSWGETIEKNATAVNVWEKKLEQSDLRSIAAMTDIRTLDLSGCDLSACDFSSITFASNQLSDINHESARGINDFSFLEDMRLSKLGAKGCSDFDDAALAYVNLQNLRTLNVSGTAVTDLSVLVKGESDSQGLPLVSLAFGNTEVRDIAVLGQMQRLADVDGSNSKVTSLAALAPLTNLKELYFDGCAISKVADMFSSLKLQTLSLAGTGVTGLSGFNDCTVLTDIDLSDNPKLASMDWLDAQNYTTLKKLDLSRTGLAADDLAWIAKCPELTDLSLDGVALTDLSCVSGLTNLRNISAINCGLEDISGLSESPQLEKILLSCNNIKSVEALSGLSLEKRPTIELTNNAIETVAELPVGEYYALMLYGNAGNVADTLPEGIKAHEVSTAYFDEMRGTSLADVTNELFIVGCPQKQVVKMKDVFGSRLNLVTEEELWDLYATNSLPYKLGDMSYFVSVVTESAGSYDSTSSSESSSSSGSGGMPSVSDTIAYDEEVGFTL